MKASILAVGSELTVGQILNKNAQWISQKVYGFGIPLACHLTVADEHQAILDGLNYCKDRSDLLFVTGGLGPTSDDFTRDVIAKWTHSDLQFDESSWQHIVDRLQARKVTIRDSQKQQCYFPVGAKIIKNEMGTANAFALSFGKLRIFVLPGPPREVEAVWPEISVELEHFSRQLDPLITKSWDTLGQGESEIAFLIEKVLKDCKFEIGYRAHLPFVEVKLSYPKSQTEKATEFVSAIEKALGPWIVSRNGFDSAAAVAKKLENYNSVQLIDTVSGPYLLNRLLPKLNQFLKSNGFNYAQKNGETASSSLVLSLTFEKEIKSKARVSIVDNILKNSNEFIVDTPPFYQSELMLERARQYFAEMALMQWSKHLHS
jgi:nicotinamide-nucleotide amidase